MAKGHVPVSIPQDRFLAASCQESVVLAERPCTSRWRIPSKRPQPRRGPDFKAFPEFQDASYAKRYEILLGKLVRERFYDAACFLLSDTANAVKGRGRPEGRRHFSHILRRLNTDRETGSGAGAPHILA